MFDSEMYRLIVRTVNLRKPVSLFFFSFIKSNPLREVVYMNYICIYSYMNILVYELYMYILVQNVSGILHGPKTKKTLTFLPYSRNFFPVRHESAIVEKSEKSL